MRALIVDSAAGRGSLAAVRALAHAGWTVGVATPTRTGLPALSRFAAYRHTLQPLAAGAEEYLQAVTRAARAGAYQLVFASSDAEILTLSRERGRIPAHIPYPEHATLVGALDKRELARAAAAAGLRTPPLARSAAEALEQWGHGPLIVKESLHGARTPAERFRHFAPERFERPDAAEARVREITAGGGDPLVQPSLAGRLMAFTSVTGAEGQMLARVQQVAERTYPLRAGLSARAVTVPIDEQLAAGVRRLLAELDWCGLSELQFIAPSEGSPQLLDFNGRFYGSLALAFAAGVNLPDIWARSALGLPLASAPEARPGVRYQWLEGDLRAAREMRGGAVRDIAGCIAYARASHASIWSPRDPLPGLKAAAGMIERSARAAARR